MDFSSSTDELMKPFLNSFGKCEQQKRSVVDNKLFEKTLIPLYEDIYEANEFVFKAGCFTYKEIKRAAIKNAELTSGRFFPTIIQKYIKDNEQGQLLFSCGNVGGREIHIHFSLFTAATAEQIEIYRQRAKMMYIWLSICAKYASHTCATILNIYIYPTPFTKMLPGSPSGILGPEHVNTAFTAACAANGQLIIFREEEWFKVFLHETFHAYGLDFATSEFGALKKNLFQIFPIKSDFDVFEAYTETWARIINCAFCGFNALANKRDKKTFLLNTNFCLELERMFAIYQCTKILGFMGLKYGDLYEKTSRQTYLRTNLYRENTHVFSYYILTAAFLNDYKGFMLWCKKNNKVLLKFNATAEQFQSFSNYIDEIYSCISLLNGIAHMDNLAKQHHNNKNKITSTTRMSIIHTI
jgi:hypothetical protein